MGPGGDNLNLRFGRSVGVQCGIQGIGLFFKLVELCLCSGLQTQRAALPVHTYAAQHVRSRNGSRSRLFRHAEIIKILPVVAAAGGAAPDGLWSLPGPGAVPRRLAGLAILRVLLPAFRFAGVPVVRSGILPGMLS